MSKKVKNAWKETRDDQLEFFGGTEKRDGCHQEKKIIN